MQVWKETSRSGVRSDMCIRRRNRCSEREELRYSERNQYDPETDDGEPTICIYAGKHPGAVQAVRESRLRGQRPPHLPGQARRQLTGSMTPPELAMGSAAVRRVRTALHRWRRSTGGGRSQRTTPYQPPAICAIALWRETLFLVPLCPAQKEA